MTVTTNYLVTGNGITGSTANAVQALVSGARKNDIMVVGDSWAARAYNVSGLAVSYQDTSPLSWAQALSGQKLNFVNPTAAVGGTTSTDWLTLIDPALLGYTPKFVVCFLGINDISVDTAVATTIANLQVIYDKILATGASLIACNVGSYGPGYSVVGDTLAVKTARRAILNKWIADFVAARSNCHLIDTFSILVDPNNGNGYSLAANADTNPTNGIHPSAQGARRIGAAIATIINGVVTTDSNYHASSYTDGYEYDSASTNRLSNPLFLSSGGTTSVGAGTTITATVIAASWTVTTAAGGTATVVCTTPARTVANDGDAIGNNQRMAITGTNSTDQVTLSGGSIGARFTAGDVVVGEAFIRVTSATALQGVRLSISSSADAVSETKSGMSYVAANASYDQSDCLMVIRTPPITVRSGTLTSTIWQLIVKFSGAGGATVDVGRAAWRKIN